MSKTGTELLSSLQYSYNLKYKRYIELYTEHAFKRHASRNIVVIVGLFVFVLHFFCLVVLGGGSSLCLFVFGVVSEDLFDIFHFHNGVVTDLPIIVELFP